MLTAILIRVPDHRCDADIGISLSSCASVQQLRLALELYNATYMLNSLPRPGTLRTVHLIFHFISCQFDVHDWFALRRALEDTMLSERCEFRIQLYTLFDEDTIVQGHVDIVNGVIATFIHCPFRFQIDVYGYVGNRIGLCSQFLTF